MLLFIICSLRSWIFASNRLYSGQEHKVYSLESNKDIHDWKATQQNSRFFQFSRTRRNPNNEYKCNQSLKYLWDPPKSVHEHDNDHVTGPTGVSRCLTLWSVVGDDGHGLPGVLQGGGSLFVSGVTEVHPVHLKTATQRYTHNIKKTNHY